MSGVRTAVLFVHVVAGTAGLLLGPLAVVVLRSPATRRLAAVAYHVAVSVVALSALALAVLDWSRLWWLVPVAAATQAAALSGLWVKGRVAHWPGWHVHLLGGSYVALVTGLLVVSWGNPLAWILPAVLAQPPIALAKARVRRSATAAQPG